MYKIVIACLFCCAFFCGSSVWAYGNTENRLRSLITDSVCEPGNAKFIDIKKDNTYINWDWLCSKTKNNILNDHFCWEEIYVALFDFGAYDHVKNCNAVFYDFVAEKCFGNNKKTNWNKFTDWDKFMDFMYLQSGKSNLFNSVVSNRLAAKLVVENDADKTVCVLQEIANYGTNLFLDVLKQYADATEAQEVQKVLMILDLEKQNVINKK